MSGSTEEFTHLLHVHSKVKILTFLVISCIISLFLPSYPPSPPSLSVSALSSSGRLFFLSSHLSLPNEKGLHLLQHRFQWLIAQERIKSWERSWVLVVPLMLSWGEGEKLLSSFFFLETRYEIVSCSNSLLFDEKRVCTLGAGGVKVFYFCWWFGCRDPCGKNIWEEESRSKIVVFFFFFPP